MMKLVKRVATVAILGMTMAAPAVAQFEWHPDHILPPGLPNPPAPWDGRKREPSLYHFGDPVDTRFTLVNPTPWHIAYSINGFQKPLLQAGQRTTWNFHGNTEHYPKMHIAIDNGRGRTLEYDLEDGHTYHFFLRNGAIDLGN